ncbi:conserved hypothetical protein [Ricinus communis]|uniref:Uncharacterized protein n=1 Tax=Ricinus communis TaxID=3988 RepID=B9RX22_RICCO|nr:conserved hypothetical protein [Ricinus communis]
MGIKQMAESLLVVLAVSSMLVIHPYVSAEISCAERGRTPSLLPKALKIHLHLPRPTKILKAQVSVRQGWCCQYPWT